MTAPTYYDIRRLTGLSLSTISKFFNGGNVLPANREALERAVRELDFRPNVDARALRSKRSRRVGVLVPALDVDFHMAIVAGLEARLRTYGISTLVRSAGGEHADTPDAAEGLADTLVDGLFVVPRQQDEPALAKIVARGMPTVSIDRPIGETPTDSVLLDNREAGAIAARHLFDHNHRDVGIIAGDLEVWSIRERLAGVLAVAAERGLAPPEAAVVPTESLTIADGRRAAMRLLARHPRPSAIVAPNYHLTLGALIAINESGLRIPDQISIVGFDIDDVARTIVPTPTYVLQPISSIAAHAADLMLARLAGDGGPVRSEILGGELVVGASVRTLTNGL